MGRDLPCESRKIPRHGLAVFHHLSAVKKEGVMGKIAKVISRNATEIEGRWKKLS